MIMLNRFGLLLAIVSIIALLFVPGHTAYAQDDAPADEASSDEAMPDDSPEMLEGVNRGVYWWAEVDPAAIATFAEFGIDIVAIRYGEIGLAGDAQETAAPAPSWKSDGDPEILSALPPILDYRLVVDTDTSFWHSSGTYNLTTWLAGALAPALQQTDITIDSVEIRIPSGTTGDNPDPAVLTSFLDGLSSTDFGVPVEIGVNAKYFGNISPNELEGMASQVSGLVVYFMDFNYSSMTPQITSRPWIDGTSAELERLGISFKAVFPVYNRAIAFTDSGGGIVLGAVDLIRLEESSDVREMGTAGTEFVINQPVELPGAALKEGDRIRVLKGLSEIDLEALIAEFPDIASNCREIDLFRFPMVPHFDPSANEVLTETGWLSSSALLEEEVSPEDAEKEELDAKHNQTQQIIMIITIGLMMVVMMRMFSKGSAQKGGDSGGK